MQNEEPLTVEEIAQQLRVHVETVRNWIRSGELDAIDLGGKYRIYRTDLNEFLERRRTGKKRKKDTSE
jgi:excisionase family DNA binding protein